MIILGVETSCDETAAAVLQDGAVLSSVVSTHWLHSQFGGVVPELASRAHLRLLPPIIDEALEQAELTLQEIDGLAVTKGPGLIGALLVGIAMSKAIAFAIEKPIIGVNHLEGHLWSAAFGHPEVQPPFLALLVSGGHTMLVGVEAFGQYRMIGQTRDDAAGEAFDKVAVLCGLSYPGGAAIETQARNGDSGYHTFPVGMRGQKGYEFSFAGLKTSVANYIRNNPTVLQEHRADLFASFQEAALASLVEPTLRAFDDFGYRTLVMAGGVAANRRLRQLLSDEVSKRGGTFLSPGMEFCTDNALMIAWVGWQRLQTGQQDDLALTGEANFPVPGMTA